MRAISLIGAGTIGETICDFLGATGDYQVTVFDRDQKRLAYLEQAYGCDTQALDLNAEPDLAAHLAGSFGVLSAAPYHLTLKVAEAAAKAGVHYLDLTEDVATTRKVKTLAKGSASAFIPQCGLAPGFVSIAAYDLARRFDELDTIKMRVGALPQYPSNALNYNMTWSTDGVINEYCEPCEAIVDGRLIEVAPLEGREEFSIDGVTYEAFNTSGGLGTLCETLDGQVQTLNYRTIRYPGHALIMRVLLQDLRLRERRELLKDILEYALPTTYQDVVIIFITVSGEKKSRHVQETYTNKIYAHEINGTLRSGIQITTAAAICAVLDLLAGDKIPAKGFIRQEDIPLDLFLENRFGCHYKAEGEGPVGAAHGRKKPRLAAI